MNKPGGDLQFFLESDMDMFQSGCFRLDKSIDGSDTMTRTMDMNEEEFAQLIRECDINRESMEFSIYDDEEEAVEDKTDKMDQIKSFQEGLGSVYIYIEPNGGNSSSLFRAMLLWRHHNDVLLLSMINTECHSHVKEKELIANALLYVHALQSIENMSVVLVVQNNIGLEGSHVVQFVEGLNRQNISIMCEPDGRVGVHTTADSKKRGALELGRLVGSNKIRFHPKFPGGEVRIDMARKLFGDSDEFYEIMCQIALWSCPDSDMIKLPRGVDLRQ